MWFLKVKVIDAIGLIDVFSIELAYSYIFLILEISWENEWWKVHFFSSTCTSINEIWRNRGSYPRIVPYLDWKKLFILCCDNRYSAWMEWRHPLTLSFRFINTKSFYNALDACKKKTETWENKLLVSRFVSSFWSWIKEEGLVWEDFFFNDAFNSILILAYSEMRISFWCISICIVGMFIRNVWGWDLQVWWRHMSKINIIGVRCRHLKKPRVSTVKITSSNHISLKWGNISIKFFQTISNITHFLL